MNTFKENFNFFTNIFILTMLFIGTLIYADTNGIWNEAQDLRGGIIGLDEQDLTSFYQFINPVYFMNNVGIGTKNPTSTLEVNGTIKAKNLEITSNSNLNQINSNSITTNNLIVSNNLDVNKINATNITINNKEVATQEYVIQNAGGIITTQNAAQIFEGRETEKFGGNEYIYIRNGYVYYHRSWGNINLGSVAQCIKECGSIWISVTSQFGGSSQFVKTRVTPTGILYLYTYCSNFQQVGICNGYSTSSKVIPWKK